MPGNTLAKAATSAAVVDQPTDIRRDCSGSAPIASSTGEGSRTSDEQAEPECTAMPARSSDRRTASPFTPPTATQAICGTRSAGSPTTSTPETPQAAANNALV